MTSDGATSGLTGDEAKTRTDVRVCAALLGGAGLVFMVESLIRLSSQGTGILYVPIVQLVLDGTAVGVILTGNRLLRPGVLIIAILGSLVHMVILLGGGPIWTRVVSALLAVMQLYVLVLLNTKPIRVHFGLDTYDDPMDLE
ncbi:MAG TPA: hypothetical protein VH352_14840 [Pseudonocardiaceae bacterium]|jgi:hypothetical protein|nr:hypothetical protein [Pseudonocardiaceae bacterium]